MVYVGCIKTPSRSNKILHESINIISKKNFLSSIFLPDLCEMFGSKKRQAQGERRVMKQESIADERKTVESKGRNVLSC